MRYFRCKCGEHTAWSSMGVPSCDGCDTCGTTLAESPNSHTEIQPHDWREEWIIDKQTGERSKQRMCLQCMRKEPVEPSPLPAAPTSEDTK